MLETFHQMIFNMNEGMHHNGLLDVDRYITEFQYIASMVFTVILIYGFIEIVLKSEWFEKKRDIYYNRLIKTIFAIDVLIILSVALYLGAYVKILFVVATILIVLIIAMMEEFAGFRRWLDERFGWLL